jgi:hypothetical protein
LSAAEAIAAARKAARAEAGKDALAKQEAAAAAEKRLLKSALSAHLNRRHHLHNEFRFLQTPVLPTKRETDMQIVRLHTQTGSLGAGCYVGEECAFGDKSSAEAAFTREERRRHHHGAVSSGATLHRPVTVDGVVYHDFTAVAATSVTVFEVRSATQGDAIVCCFLLLLLLSLFCGFVVVEVLSTTPCDAVRRWNRRTRHRRKARLGRKIGTGFWDLDSQIDVSNSLYVGPERVHKRTYTTLTLDFICVILH